MKIPLHEGTSVIRVHPDYGSAHDVATVQGQAKQCDSSWSMKHMSQLGGHMLFFRQWA